MSCSMTPHLIIRCDASPEIGVGHVLRCLAFAGLWPDPEKVLFISDLGGAELAGRIRGAGHTLLELGQSGDKKNDVSWLDIAGGDIRPEDSSLLLDGYHFDSALQKRLRPLVKKLIVWDDYNHLVEYHAHIILNDGPGFQAQDYNAPANTLFLLGPEYILLRPEFLDHAASRGRDLVPRAANILLSFGGADPKGFSLEALRFLSQRGALPQMTEGNLPALHIKVVAGAAYARLPELKKLADELNCGPQPDKAVMLTRHIRRETEREAEQVVEILHNVSDMPALMLWADLALGAAGGTAFELCYLGVPQLLCVASENQRAVANWLAVEGAARVIQSFAELPLEEFRTFLDDVSLRQGMSRAAMSLVDGLGRERLRRFILELC